MAAGDDMRREFQTVIGVFTQLSLARKGRLPLNYHQSFNGVGRLSAQW